MASFWLTTSNWNVARLRPDFEGRPDFADVHACANRIAKLHGAGEIPVEIDETQARARRECQSGSACRSRSTWRVVHARCGRHKGWPRRTAHRRGSGVKSPTSPANRLTSPSPIVRPGVTTRTPACNSAMPASFTHISRVRLSPTLSRCTSSGPSPNAQESASPRRLRRGKKSCESPAPPWTWIARSMICPHGRRDDNLGDRYVVAPPPWAPRRSMLHAAFRVTSRACSSSQARLSYRLAHGAHLRQRSPRRRAVIARAYTSPSIARSARAEENACKW